jgi:hypothetical protein
MPRARKKIDVTSDPTLEKHRYVSLVWGATYLDVSVDFLRDQIAAGKLPVSRLAQNVIRVKLSDLDRLAGAR